MEIEIAEYNSEEGFKFIWEDNFEIEVKYENQAIVIKANKQGLVSLAKQLLTLSQDGIPNGYHLHYDEHNSLEVNSTELIIEKK